MSFDFTRRVWKLSQAKNGARLVLAVLADYADDDGMCFPSRGTLSKESAIADRSLDRALQWLTSHGELSIEVGTGPKGCNKYRILLPPVKTASPVNLTPPVKTAPPPPVKMAENPPSKLRPKPSGTTKEPPGASSAKPQKDVARATLAECRDFAVECGLPAADGEAFYHGKEGNGWKNGRNPVRNWQATFRNWQGNGWHPSQKAGGINGHAANGAEKSPSITPAEIADWIKTRPDYASKRLEWSTWDRLPSFAKGEFRQARRLTTAAA